MDLLEYQGKRLLAEAGIPVPPGVIVRSPQEAAQAQEAFEGEVAVKAQTPFGGRGKAGAIKFVAAAEEAAAAATELLGRSIKGHTVQELVVEAKVPIESEYYCAIVMDRRAKAPAALFSAAGGVDIEELAANTPHLLQREAIDPLAGLLPHQARALAYRAGLKDYAAQVSEVVGRAYSMFAAYDCMLVEMNPLVRVDTGELLALDAKVQVDDNALYRHPELLGFEAALGIPAAEQRAEELGLHYVTLDGDIGIVGNGAGLVMATIDLVAAADGRPANFLDVGGGAKANQISGGLRIVLGDPRVRVVLVNIFGGITRCEEVAEGILEVMSESDGRLRCPVVLRLDGNGAAEAKEMLRDMPVITARSFVEAASMVAEMSVAADGGGSS